MKDEVLLDIATFLVRRWSENKDTVVRIEANKAPTSNVRKNLVTLPNLDFYQGSDFERYRQWRFNCWKQAMRIKHSTKSLTSEHAHGFLLNCLEDRRVEQVGIPDWPGMRNEMIFNEGVSWFYEPLLNDLMPGRYRILVAFSQYFRTGWVKGDADPNMLTLVEEAAKFADGILEESMQKGYKTDWLDKQVPKLLQMLEVDALLNVPILRSKRGLTSSEDQLSKLIQKILREHKIDPADEMTKNIIDGKDVRSEFEQLKKETRKVIKASALPVTDVDVSVPEPLNVNTASLYDNDLINKLKAEFRSWKTGWVEQHGTSGDEFDEESYVEKYSRPFFLDLKIKFKANVAILLDHSSSIAEMELPYKRATVALCKALDYLGAKSVVLAFSTREKKVKCWLIKPVELKWTNLCTARLAQIQASGGTPLAEVYESIRSLIERFKPDIFLTLTDGEPNDPTAVRDVVLKFKQDGISMVSVGIGKDITEAVRITKKLKNLNYDRSVAISDLHEMPKKVLYLLQ